MSRKNYRKRNVDYEFVFYIDKITGFESYLGSDVDDFIIENKNIQFVVEDVKITKDMVKEASLLAEKHKKCGVNISFHFEVDNFGYNTEELTFLVDMENQLKTQGASLFIKESFADYSIEEYVNAYINAKGFIDAVKELNASPFERFIIVYNYITSFKYQENEDDPHKARNLIDVINGFDIVCLGYGNLMSYMLEELGIKSVPLILKVEETDKDEVGKHANNLVYLKDDKYGICGFFYADACWDYTKEGMEPFLNYNFCLLPFKDVDHIKNCNLTFSDGFANVLLGRTSRESFIQEIMFDPIKCRRVAQDLGYDGRCSDFQVCLGGSGNNAVELRRKAVNKLIQVLEDANFKKDAFKNIKVPSECGFEYLLACALKGDDSLLDKNVKFLKDYISNYDKYKDEEFASDIYDCEDFVKFLKDFENSPTCSVHYMDVQKYYFGLSFAEFLDGVLINQEKNNQVIGLETFKRGIENINLLQGTSEKFAKVQSQRAIDRCVRRAEFCFTTNAQNCFSQEALKRRNEQCGDNLSKGGKD